MISAATTAATAVVAGLLTSAPITLRRLVSRIIGTSANGIPNDRMTWLNTSVTLGFAPTPTTTSAGASVIARRRKIGIRRWMNPCITTCPDIVPTDEEAKLLYRYTRIDVLIAMVIAGLINMAMLVIAATVFFGSGLHNVDSLEGAHRTLEPLLGGASSILFALALTASGLSSSTVGTMSGQVVMQGFIQRRVPLFVRRFVTMVPAFIVIGIGLDPSRTLVISQVILSFGIPFALIPLVMFTSRRDIMGVLVNHPLTAAAAVVVATIISGLNIFLLGQTFGLVPG